MMKKHTILGVLTLILCTIPLTMQVLALPNEIMSAELITENPIVLDSPLFTRYEDEVPYSQPIIDMSEFTLLMENEALQLYYNPVGLALRMVNKSTGFIWSTDVPNIGDYSLNAINRRRIRSSTILNIRDSQDKAATITASDNGVLSSVELIDDDTARFSVDMSITNGVFYTYDIHFDESGFRLDFDTQQLVESNGTRVIDITFFPFMGAVYKNEIPGYALIPSGNGGLVRFESSATMSSPFVERMYGPDLAQVINYSGNFGFFFPVYGIVHGEEQNALFVHIDEGSEMSVFRYTPTGTTTDFHTVSNTFLIREPYTLNIPNSDSIFVIPESKYEYQIGFSVSILTGEEADYIGMAKLYRSILQEMGSLSDTRTIRDDLGVQVSVLGGDTEKGLFFDNLIKMTSTKQLLDINDELIDEGLSNINYLLRGFNYNGMTDHSYKNYEFSSQFGSLSDLNELNYTLMYNPVELIVDNGKAPNSSLQNIGKFYLSQWIDRNYTSYFQNMDTMNRYVPSALEDLTNQGGVTLAGVNGLLYSDPYNGYTRTQSVAAIQSWINQRISMYRATEYLLGQTSEILQLDLYHSRQKFITDSVPFLQYVFQGYLNNYSPYLNYSSNHQVDVLKVIEYNTQPSFLISNEPSYLLSETTSKNMYASHFESLKETISADYQLIQQALTPVMNSLVIDREVLAKGVTRVDYDNGVSIYFNYTPESLLIEGIQVGAMSYAHKEAN